MYLRRLVQGSKPAMDAIHIELDGFRSFNHYQGHENGNLLLKKTAELINRELVKVKGIACHLSLGEFCVYCRHKTNYPEIFEKMQRELSEEKGYDAVTLKAGICEKVDKTAALESWFECAKTACRDAAAREGVQTEIYSGNFLETDRLVEQLKDNIQSEIRQKNFILKYVPVYRLDSGDAKLVGVEVKTFWNTSRFGMIDPAQYVPLMQRHGLIAELDNYVRREAAAQINRWRNKFGIMLSATLRLSGATLSDSKIVSRFDELADEFSLSSYSFVLAVKETLFSADDGQKTVDMIKAADSGYYDIVLMDIQMPHMDGYEAAKLIRSLPESKKASIPIIAVTANAFAEDKKIALEAGMDGYLAKPYDIPEMMKLLGDLLCYYKVFKFRVGICFRAEFYADPLEHIIVTKKKKPDTLHKIMAMFCLMSTIKAINNSMIFYY